MLTQTSKEDLDFYPENRPPPEKDRIQVDDAIISACATMAFAAPYGVFISAGISLGWVILQNSNFGELTSTTAASVAKAQLSTYNGKDLRSINNNINEVVNWMSDNEKLFTDLKKEQVEMLKKNHLEWLEEQSTPGQTLAKAINDQCF